MYKVFFNEKKISFLPPGKITLSKPTVKFHKIPDKLRLENLLFDFVEGDDNEQVWENKHPEELFDVFRLLFKNIDAAGGIVLRRNKILFIKRNNKWDLPKGKIDKGETNELAAIREVGEECGIKRHKIVKKVPSTYHIYQSPHSDTLGEWIFKETRWFEMQYSGRENGVPQTEEDITEIRWFGRNELNEVLKNTYENLKQIISLYLD